METIQKKKKNGFSFFDWLLHDNTLQKFRYFKVISQ